MDESLYTRIDHEDGRVEFVPKVTNALDWVPGRGRRYWTVSTTGTCCDYVWDDDWHDARALASHNCFPTEAQAEKAAKYIRRYNAIIRACLLVDPDFEPDWGDERQVKWFIDSSKRTHLAPAYVSTKEKAKQVRELLIKWGVK